MSATGQPDNACQIGFGPMTEGFSYAPFNDLEAFKAACTENTIGIMVEPVQGEGGVYPATQEFLQGLREFCDEKGILLLLDEVQSGWGRTGALMSYMNYGIKPDIVSMAKAMGGGMPIGAICATEEVSKAFTMGSHGTTFGGHPVCCAASPPSPKSSTATCRAMPRRSAHTSSTSFPSCLTSRRPVARACSSASNSTAPSTPSMSSTAASTASC